MNRLLQPLPTSLVIWVSIVFHCATALSAQADYGEMLRRGTTRAEVAQLYRVYHAEVLNEEGDRSAAIEKLSGGPEFAQSFLLACLSNGWAVRAVDLDHSLAPPAGVWAFTKENHAGLVRQFPSDARDLRCIDIRNLGGFKMRSLRIGTSVKAHLYPEPNFRGDAETLTDVVPSLDIRFRSMRLRTPPRVDDITISEYASTEDGSAASFYLHVSGANIDEGAIVQIDGSDHAEAEMWLRVNNSRWLGLGTDIARAGYPLDPAFFAFPIYHYDALRTRVGPIQCGQDLKIRVTNPDGQASSEVTFTVPTEDNLDSDGDGLLDAWETGSVDGLNLAELGANPLRKDLYVEVDRMIVPGRVWSDFSESSYPRPTIFKSVAESFARAPVLNPDGSGGVTLHIDYGQKDFKGSPGRGGSEIPWKRYIGFKDVAETKVTDPEQYCNATLIRNDPEYFDPNRKKVFRYCIFADQKWDSRSTGQANKSTIFFLSLGICRLNAIDHNYQVGVFTHEFGHQLGLTHTGLQNHTYTNKPNYNSIMNYLYTFAGHDIDGKVDGDEGKVTGDQVYAYSEGMRAPLNEAKLIEVLGVANHYPRDWNGNGKIDREPVQVFLRNPRYKIPRTLNDSADWTHLRYQIGEE